MQNKAAYDKYMPILFMEVAVFFIGGYWLMLLSGLVVHDIFNHPGLGYWASGWIILLARWVIRAIIVKEGVLE